jgi:hypothetical protein
VRQRTDAGASGGEDAETIDRNHEHPTVIPTSVVNDDSTHASVESSDAAEADERCLMAELSIIRAGHYYCYDGYRYDRLSDAVTYAQLIQGRTRRSCSSAGS